MLAEKFPSLVSPAGLDTKVALDLAQYEPLLLPLGTWQFRQIDPLIRSLGMYVHRLQVYPYMY